MLSKCSENAASDHFVDVNKNITNAQWRKKEILVDTGALKMIWCRNKERILQCVLHILYGTYSGVLRARGLFIFKEDFMGDKPFKTHEELIGR